MFTYFFEPRCAYFCSSIFVFDMGKSNLRSKIFVEIPQVIIKNIPTSKNRIFSHPHTSKGVQNNAWIFQI